MGTRLRHRFGQQRRTRLRLLKVYQISGQCQGVTDIGGSNRVSLVNPPPNAGALFPI
jgi:hypothetical protein